MASPSRLAEALERRLRRAPVSVASAGVLAFVLLSVVSCVGPQPQSRDIARSQPTRQVTAEPWVRVLLVEKGAPMTLEVEGLCAVHTANPKTGKATIHAPVESWDGLEKAKVRSDGASIIIDGHARYSGAILLRPQKRDAFIINGHRYRGELLLKGGDDGLRAIVDLPLEDYLAGVLGREMPLGFPEPALEAQAIAARTYAIWQLRKHEGRDHDVKNDTRSQVYGGVDAEHPKAREIIERTRGQVATYKGEIFETFFHSTCGGETISHHKVFGGNYYEPLSGAKCERCAESKYHRWEVKTTKAKLVETLREKGENVVTPIRELELRPWGENPYVKSIVIDHAGGRTELTGPRFRSLMGLRSAAFRIAQQGEELTIQGQGWGHGVGLCQYGAKGFAREGLSGVQIIQHYYPSSEVVARY